MSQLCAPQAALLNVPAVEKVQVDELVANYAETVVKDGLGSPGAKAFKAGHKDSAEFLRLADTVEKIRVAMAPEAPDVKAFLAEQAAAAKPIK